MCQWPLLASNKQQGTSNKQYQQVHLLSVSALCFGPCFRLYSTSSHPLHQRMVFPNLEIEPPMHQSQVGRCPPKSVRFWAKSSHPPKTAARQRKMEDTFCNLVSLCQRALWLPLIPRYVPEKDPTKGPKWPKLCTICLQITPGLGRMLGFVHQIRFQGPRFPGPPATLHSGTGLIMGIRCSQQP